MFPLADVDVRLVGVAVRFRPFGLAPLKDCVAAETVLLGVGAGGDPVREVGVLDEHAVRVLPVLGLEELIEAFTDAYE